MACPSLTADRVCFWAAPSILDDNNYLLNIANSLLNNYEKCKQSEGYIKDLTAVLRQYVANESWRYIYPMQDAIKNKDIQLFEQNAKKLLSLFDLQEQIVDCDKNLNLQNYLNKAKKRGKTQEDKKWLVRCAKLLITFWTQNARGYDLHDYAAREYGDMLRYFYKPRWQKFIEDARIALINGKEVESYDRYKNDTWFLEDDKEYPITINNNIFEIAEKIISNKL